MIDIVFIFFQVNFNYANAYEANPSRIKRRAVSKRLFFRLDKQRTPQFLYAIHRGTRSKSKINGRTGIVANQLLPSSTVYFSKPRFYLSTLEDSSNRAFWRKRKILFSNCACSLYFAFFTYVGSSSFL